MTTQRAREIRALLTALLELGLDGLKSGADQVLDVGEVAELAGDIIALGDAIRDLAEPDDEAEALRRAEAVIQRIEERRARKVRRLRRAGRRAFVEEG